MGKDRLLRYSMQLAMLKQLLSAKKISTEEYQKIKNRLMENGLDLTKIADNVNLEPKYLSSYFKKHKNITLVKYITQKRIAYAKQLLKDTDTTISVIAIKTGFTDACMFGKIFKKNEGVTPGQYRDMSRNN